MAGKIMAAVDARHSRDTLIIARTDAVAVEGLTARSNARCFTATPALICCSSRRRRRARISPTSSSRSAAPCRWSPIWSRAARHPCCREPNSKRLGFSLVIFPGGIVRTLAKTATEYYASLATHGSTQPFRDRMFDFDKLNSLIGTPEMIERGRRLGTNEAEQDQ